MASRNARNIGLIILKNLGLTEEEAAVLEAQKPEPMNTIFARDQSGLGYKKLSTNYVAEANNVFARISAKMASDNNDSSTRTCIASTSAKTRKFIPTRLQKRSIGSLSNEDLANILSEVAPVTPSAIPQEETTTEEPKKRRRKHHHHQE